MMIRTLQLWIDDVERTGPENMECDQRMLEVASIPTLRVYRWAPQWASFGYFGNELAAAQALAHKRNWVRRPTGGGVVDHDEDWTYSLAIPSGHELAQLRGSASYHFIHQALCAALNQEGIGEFCLETRQPVASALTCFTSPVTFDVVDASGEKWAGAGQRRYRHGLLHQGSVRQRPHADQNRARRLAQQLASTVLPWAGDSGVATNPSNNRGK